MRNLRQLDCLERPIFTIDRVRDRFADYALRGETLPSDNRLTSLRLELAYFSGHAWLSARATGGAGVILRFERVRPRRAARFQPLRSHEITPEFLDRTIRALKRWKFDIVSHRRGLPQGGYAGLAATVCVPDF